MIYAGQYFDAETNLHYNYFRYYDPSTGRYITSDPRGVLLDYSDPQRKVSSRAGIQGSHNNSFGKLNHNYGYANQNPVRFVDPTGEALALPLVLPAVDVCWKTLVTAAGIIYLAVKCSDGECAVDEEDSEEERCKIIMLDCFNEVSEDNRKGHNDPYTDDLDQKVRQCVTSKAPECAKYL